MKKISTKISLVMIICSSVAILTLGGISIARAHRIVQDDAKETISWMARQYASQFSNGLDVIENSVQEMEVYFRDTFDPARLKSEPDYLAEYEQELAKYLYNFASKRSKGYAAWCYFNPTLSDTPHDVYFVDGDGDNIPDRQNYIPLDYYDETPLPTDDKQWWYGPIETKQGFWTNPYEWTLKNGAVIKVVSYAQPIFYGDELIAVIGTYFHFDEVYQEITNIEVYESGYAALLNEKMDVVIHPTYQSGTRYTSDNFATVDDGRYAAATAEIADNDYGVISYDNESGEQLLAYSKLSNGWTMLIAPERKEVFAKVYALTLELLAAVVFCMILAVVAACLVSVSITKSLRRVVQGANRISTGDLDVSIQVDTKDEIKTVADSLNRMTGSVKKLQGELERLAYYDELTGIPNKNLFQITASALVQQDESRYAYIILDVKKFKVINDILGYACGDLLLKCIAELLAAEFKNNECVCRYGSDVFHVMCQYQSRGELEVRLRALESRVAALRISHNLVSSIAVSFGVYVVENIHLKVESMGDKAGFALKKSKETYTPSICFFNDAIRKRILEEQEIENDMTEALANGEFKVYLQPKYSLKEAQVKGAEALVRWLHPVKGLVPPDIFIPVMEKNGFIMQLDFYMVDRVCERLRAWMDMGREPFVISVNQSRLHLHNPDYLQELTKTLARYDIPHRLIEIELTESAFFEDTQKMVQIMAGLHELDFKISMDDFGSGYSSLNMLQNIAVDVLKIDKNFFNDSSNSERGQTIVDSIISMADELDITVVAEGVETKEQVEFLKRTNCHFVQGFYYARPMPLAEFEESYYPE